MKPIVLTFDIGTQSLRAVLVSDSGEILAKAQRRFEKPYVSPHPGWAEQDGEFYWHNICDVSNELREKSAELWDMNPGGTLGFDLPEDQKISKDKKLYE